MTLEKKPRNVWEKGREQDSQSSLYITTTERVNMQGKVQLEDIQVSKNTKTQ